MNQAVSAYMYSYFHTFVTIREKTPFEMGSYSNSYGQSNLILKDHGVRSSRMDTTSFSFLSNDSSCHVKLWEDPSGYYGSRDFTGSTGETSNCTSINEYFAALLGFIN